MRRFDFPMTALLEGGGDAGGGGADPNTNPQGGDAGGGGGEAPAMLTESNEFNPDWFNHGELADHAKSLSKFKTPADLAKSYANLERMKGVPAIGEGADEKAIATFRKANGIPDQPDGYELKAPEELPEGLELPEGALEQYKALAHSINATPQQAQAIMDQHLEFLTEQSKQQQGISHQQHQESIQALRNEWGTTFDSKLENAQKAFDTFSAMAGIDLEKAGFTQDPQFVKLMATVSEKLSEGTFVQGGSNVPAGGLTGGKHEAQKIMTDSNHPDYNAFWNSHDSRHAEVQNRVAQMNR